MFTITLVVFLVVDMVWLAGIAKKFYRKELGALMRARPNGLAAALFYLIYTAGLVYFVIQPTALDGTALRAFLRGAGFGFVAYCTYDLTNLAVIENWPLKITVIDILWGSVATGITAFLVVQIL